jgi:hypothetical protein
MKMTFQEIRIIATGPCITNQLRDVNTICRRSWYIAAHIWKIYDLKIEYIKQNTKSVSLSVTLPATLSASDSLLANTECMKTVVFAARRREGVVVAHVCITNNVTVCYVSVN